MHRVSSTRTASVGRSAGWPHRAPQQARRGFAVGALHGDVHPGSRQRRGAGVAGGLEQGGEEFPGSRVADRALYFAGPAGGALQGVVDNSSHSHQPPSVRCRAEEERHASSIA